MHKSPALGTHALDNELANDGLAGFLADAEERGSVRAEEMDALQLEHDLGDEALSELRAALAAADVEIEERPRDSRPTSLPTSTSPRPASSPTACSSS